MASSAPMLTASWSAISACGLQQQQGGRGAQGHRQEATTSCCCICCCRARRLAQSLPLLCWPSCTPARCAALPPATAHLAPRTPSCRFFSRAMASSRYSAYSGSCIALSIRLQRVRRRAGRQGVETGRQAGKQSVLGSCVALSSRRQASRCEWGSRPRQAANRWQGAGRWGKRRRPMAKRELLT